MRNCASRRWGIGNSQRRVETRHPNPPLQSPYRRVAWKLAASRSPGTHREAQEKSPNQARPAAPSSSVLLLAALERIRYGRIRLVASAPRAPPPHAPPPLASVFSLCNAATTQSRLAAAACCVHLYIHARTGRGVSVCVWHTVVAKRRECPWARLFVCQPS